MDEDAIQKGRILRVKEGYNPNSSSVGSVVFALPAALLAVPAAFGVASAVLLSALIKKRKDVSATADATKPSVATKDIS